MKIGSETDIPRSVNPAVGGAQGGGYRRDHLRALAQRVEVADKEVRIMGSKSDLLRALGAVSGTKPATPGVPSSVLKWRTGRDSNSRPLPAEGCDLVRLRRAFP